MTTESGPANPSNERAEMPADRLQAIVQLCRDIVRCLKLDLAIDPGSKRNNLHQPLGSRSASPPRRFSSRP